MTKIILAGAGAFGQKHLDAVKAIGGIEVDSLVGRELAATQEVARKYAIAHATTSLTEALGRPGVTAAILATPTQLHAAQAIECLKAGKHVQVEIPLAD
ncbi:MAG: Gfo/Idh/MocA family protein, partial [Steroidobacteraceae bacterium]